MVTFLAVRVEPETGRYPGKEFFVEFRKPAVSLPDVPDAGLRWFSENPGQFRTSSAFGISTGWTRMEKVVPERNQFQ